MEGEMRLLSVVILLLVACGGPGAVPPTAQGVVDRIAAAGIAVEQVKPGIRPADSPLPNSYSDWLEFTITDIAPSGGQVFVCRTKPNCDALYAHFDMFRGLVGPYLYQSPNGLVVAQLNSGLPADSAATAEAVIASIK
jgi:hypothetical protein